MKQDLTKQRYAYWWADGIHTGLRQVEDARQCLLVIISVTPEGKKEMVTIDDSLRESRELRLDVLRDFLGVAWMQSPCWPSAMARWASGRRLTRSIRERSGSVAGGTSRSSPIAAVDWRAGYGFDGSCMAAGEVGTQLVV